MADGTAAGAIESSRAFRIVTEFSIRATAIIRSQSKARRAAENRRLSTPGAIVAALKKTEAEEISERAIVRWVTDCGGFSAHGMCTFTADGAGGCSKSAVFRRVLLALLHRANCCLTSCPFTR